MVVSEFSTAHQSTINNTLNNKVQDRTRQHMQEMHINMELLTANLA